MSPKPETYTKTSERFFASRTSDHVWSHSPIPSVDTQSMDDSSVPGFTLSDVSSLKSMSSGSEQSIDRLVMSDSDKKMRHVVYLIEEMLQTEQTYIDALTDVTEGYIAKIREGEETGFTQETLAEAFVNIEDIRNFHIELLNALNGCNKEHKLVANVFIQNIARFEMYIEFCANFPRSLERLGQLHREEPSKTFLTECQNALGHIFPVEEYLHRAVQRVLKYPLLFRDMEKKLVDLDGHNVVEEALNRVLITAVKINAVKRVQELQSKELIGWEGEDLSAKGDLLLEDSFKLLGAKDPRFLFLFQKSLLVTKARPDGTFIYKKEIMMDNVTLKEQVSGDFLKWEIMESKGGTDKYTLQAKDGDQKEAWVREVKRCIIDSTPGLTEEMKETLLQKLPSLNDHSQQIDKIWKGIKGFKKRENVQIIHNPDTPVTEDASKTFGWGPPDSYSDKNTQMVNRPGKRKLMKKKTSSLKISHPVQMETNDKPGSADNSPKLSNKNVKRSESVPQQSTKKRACIEEKRESTVKLVQRDISPYTDPVLRASTPESLAESPQLSDRESPDLYKDSFKRTVSPDQRMKSPDLIESLDFDQIKSDIFGADEYDGGHVKPSRPAPPPPPPQCPPPDLQSPRRREEDVPRATILGLQSSTRSMKSPAPEPPRRNSDVPSVPTPPPAATTSQSEPSCSTSNLSPTPILSAPTLSTSPTPPPRPDLPSAPISAPISSAPPPPPHPDLISPATTPRTVTKPISSGQAASPHPGFQSPRPSLKTAETPSPKRSSEEVVSPDLTEPISIESITNLQFNQPISISSLAYNEPVSIASLPGSPKPGSPELTSNLPTAEEIQDLLEDSFLENNIIEMCDQALKKVERTVVCEKEKAVFGQKKAVCDQEKAVCDQEKVSAVLETERPVSAVRPVQQVRPRVKAGDTTEASETPSYIDIDNSKQQASKQLSRGTGGKSRRSAMKKKNTEFNIGETDNFPTSEACSEPSIEGPEFTKEAKENKEEAAVGLVAYLGSLIMDSPYHPAPLLGLVYLLACLVWLLPLYITFTVGLGSAALVYKFSPPHPQGDKYKVQ